MIRVFLGFSLLALAPVANCADGAMAFEVASVKPAAPQAPGRFQISMGGDPGRINYSFVSLKNLIERAYSIKSYQVTGPDWLESERFDVVAKLPEGAKQEDVPKMLQTLLAERFKLTIHREQKNLPVYALVVGKTGSKMSKADGEPGGMRMSMSPKGRQLQGKVTMDGLVSFLARMLDRPVIDQTQLAGTYDINLEWMPDDREGGPMGGMRMIGAPPPADHPPASENSDDAAKPGIFAALQEKLGLKLESRKGDVDIVVVDSAEKSPTQN
jgi:uncharacterized protein (TIGR03435 family)